MNKTVVVLRMHDPSVVWLHLAFATVATAILTGFSTPSSLEAQLTPTFRYIWAGMLLVGSLAAITGWALFYVQRWVRHTSALYLKAAGDVGVASAFFIYGVALWAANGRAAIGAGPVMVGISLWAATRAWLLYREASRL